MIKLTVGAGTHTWINPAYVVRMEPPEQNTDDNCTFIILADGHTIEVDETPEQIMHLIAKAKMG